MKKKLVSLVLLVLMLAACSTANKKEMPTSAESEQVTKIKAHNIDAEIVNMLMTANTEEMNLAMLGKKNALNKDVKAYAKRVFNEHAKNNDKASLLRNEHGIRLSETNRSKQLKTKVESSVENLKNIKGNKFNKAFIDSQVVFHQEILHKLETNLIPNSQNGELKAMLKETKEKVENHLREAQELQSRLQ